MGLRTIVGIRDGLEDSPAAVMFDSCIGVCFGPVFETFNECEAFQRWWDRTQDTDLRGNTPPMGAFADKRDEWVTDGRPYYDAEDDEVKDER